jgi:hypothetical protein
MSEYERRACTEALLVFRIHRYPPCRLHDLRAAMFLEAAIK